MEGEHHKRTNIIRKRAMKEKFDLVGGSKLREVLNENPNYRFFKRCGFAFRGAEETEDDKSVRTEYVSQERRSRETTFEERVDSFINWSAAIDITVDHDSKEIHANGFSENDML